MGQRKTADVVILPLVLHQNTIYQLRSVCAFVQSGRSFLLNVNTLCRLQNLFILNAQSLATPSSPCCPKAKELPGIVGLSKAFSLLSLVPSMQCMCAALGWL